MALFGYLFLVLSLILPSLAAPAMTVLYDCSGGVNKNHVVKKVEYKGCNYEGNGVLAATVNVTHPYVFPIVRKCWVELWNVQGAIIDAPWSQASDVLCCGGSASASSCSTGLTNTSQYCQSVSVGVSHDDAVDISIPYRGVTVSLDFGSSTTITTTQETCQSSSTEDTCYWDDEKCHSICMQQKLLALYGYKRVRCNWHAAVISHWLPKYDKTVCIQDFVTMSPFDGFGHERYCNGAGDPINPCRGFAPLPSSQPPLGDTASCFHFQNPIKPEKG